MVGIGSYAGKDPIIEHEYENILIAPRPRKILGFN